MVVLFLSELNTYLQVEVTSEMFIDEQKETFKKLKINFNMTFPSLPCSVLSVEIEDILGNKEVITLNPQFSNYDLTRETNK
jgi:endoplasmic reticulum-Golgi intermediate compartment protein 3